MELEAIGILPIAEGLRLKVVASGEKGRSAGQIEAFTMPLIDLTGKAARADPVPMFSGMNRVIANLDSSLRMRPDPVTEMAGQHLGAEANAEKWLAFLERNANPIDLAAHPGIFVVDAHRTAKNNNTGVVFQRRRQLVSKPGSPDIKFKPFRPQNPSEPSGSRMFLVQNDKNPAK